MVLPSQYQTAITMQAKKNSIVVATAIIAIGAFSRLIPHMPNFSVIEALALFGGAYLTSRVLAVAVPIIALYLSDLVINNTIARPFFPEQEGIILYADYMPYNLLAMVAIVLLARVTLSKVSALRVLGSALGASVLFFIVTNVGSWLTYPIYSKDLAGLSAAFTAAVPFYQNTWVSSVLFSTVLFGSYELYKSYAASKLSVSTVSQS